MVKRKSDGHGRNTQRVPTGIFGTLPARAAAGHIRSMASHRNARLHFEHGLRTAHIRETAATRQAHNAGIPIDTDDQIVLLHGKRIIGAFDDVGGHCFVGKEQLRLVTNLEGAEVNLDDSGRVQRAFIELLVKACQQITTGNQWQT